MPRIRRRPPTLAEDPAQRSAFESFYAHYPLKRDRIAAERAWFNLLPDPALREEIAWSVEDHKRTRQWREGIGIPYPATYLNRRRWTDDLSDELRNLPKSPAAPLPLRRASNLQEWRFNREGPLAAHLAPLSPRAEDSKFWLRVAYQALRLVEEIPDDDPWTFPPSRWEPGATLLAHASEVSGDRWPSVKETKDGA